MKMIPRLGYLLGILAEPKKSTSRNGLHSVGHVKTVSAANGSLGTVPRVGRIQRVKRVKSV